MKDVRRHTELSQQTNSANAKQHLLHDARFTITAVEMSGDPAISFRVFRNVCIEKIEDDASDIGPPHLGQDVALTDQHFDAQRCAVVVLDEVNRKIVWKRLTVVLFLPPVGAQSLAEITVAIQQTDRD